ncbi:MAG: hypothetical protein ACRDF0_04775, partial [Candidatus Limnocylindria bacterium]
SSSAATAQAAPRSALAGGRLVSAVLELVEPMVEALLREQLLAGIGVRDLRLGGERRDRCGAALLADGLRRALTSY